MRIADKIPFLVFALLLYVVFYTSCANQGMPVGGLKDTIPPSVIETTPVYRGLNYKGKEVRLTFSEYIIPDKVQDILVISPPLSKRPTIRTKSKTLIVGFNEDLKDSTTYSLDFKDAIVDNNESNPLNDLRFLFSTWDKLDTFRVAGMVKNAFNLEPVENTVVALHKNLHDSAVFRLKPNYIARTDKKGIYYFDNISPGTYHLFALNDGNTNLQYDEGAEDIAFSDSLIVPSAEYHEQPDTLARGTDSLLIVGHTQFKPDPVYLLQFRENLFEQYVRNAKRLSRNQLIFGFNEPVSDTFAINLLKDKVKDWYVMERNQKNDSLILWLTDSVLIKKDTIPAELVYYQLDSLKKIYLKRDTINLTYTGKKEEEELKSRRKSKEEEKKVVPQFDLNMEFASSTLDLNDSILFMANDPLVRFNQSMVHLTQKIDTIYTNLKYTLIKDTTSQRLYRLYIPWEPDGKYSIKVDSGAVTNIYGLTSRGFKRDFTSQKEDYYGQITVDLKEVKGNIIVQVLSNNDDEKIIRQKVTGKDGPVRFDYMKPDKYRIKIIFDRNKNGKWDTGSYQDKYQPEKVAYWKEVVKVRSNWDNQLPWILKEDLTYPKILYDKEVEEQKMKELQKKKEEEMKSRNKREPIPNDGGGGMGIPMRIGG